MLSGMLLLAAELKHLISPHVAVEGSVFSNQIRTAHSVLCDFLMTAQAAVSLGEPRPTCCWLHTDTHSHTARTHCCQTAVQHKTCHDYISLSYSIKSCLFLFATSTTRYK